jgi:anti-anti-sigma regulatory factor
MADGKILVACRHGWLVLKLVGEIRFTMGGESRPTAALDRFLHERFCATDYAHVVIDLSETETIDSTNLGLLAEIAVHAREHKLERPLMIASGGDLLRLLESVGFDQVFEVVDADDAQSRQLNDVGGASGALRSDRAMILEAHQALASLTPENEAEFHDVIRLMEQERD